MIAVLCLLCGDWFLMLAEKVNEPHIGICPRVSCRLLGVTYGEKQEIALESLQAVA